MRRRPRIPRSPWRIPPRSRRSRSRPGYRAHANPLRDDQVDQAADHALSAARAASTPSAPPMPNETGIATRGCAGYQIDLGAPASKHCLPSAAVPAERSSCRRPHRQSDRRRRPHHPRDAPTSPVADDFLPQSRDADGRIFSGAVGNIGHATLRCRSHLANNAIADLYYKRSTGASVRRAMCGHPRSIGSLSSFAHSLIEAS